MKGFIAGIPIALLAVAAQAKLVERQEHGFHPQAAGPGSGGPGFGGPGIGGPSGHDAGVGFPPGQSKPGPGAHFEPHPESHYEPHAEAHFEPHAEPHYEPHPEPHFENHPEPHFENHPEPHYAPHYSPTYEPHYEPHTSLENKLTSIKGVKNGPQESKMIFRRSGAHGHPGPHGPPGPGHGKPGPSHFEPHPETHFAPHAESHYEPHPEPHYEPHPEPHFENHPEPHFENHPEPHYAPHYSPTYEPHYEPHKSFSKEVTSIKGVNNGPQESKMIFRRSEAHGRPGAHGPPGPGHIKPGPSHFEPHPETHVAPHAESHYEPHPEPHYEPHPEPHFEHHPEPHFENHPEPHYAPHYSPTYEPHYEPHKSFSKEVTSIKGVNNGPQESKMIFRRSEAHGRPGPPGHSKPGPGSHFEPHPESHYAPHVESHYEPHPEPHYEPHPEPHFENHPEPHSENHPEPHYEPHYSPSYKPHYEPHTSLSKDFTLIEDVNNGPQKSDMVFHRRAFAPSREQEDEDSECAARVQEIVHTVTKTEYRTAEATHAVYQSTPAMQTSAIPKAHAPQQAADADFNSVPYAPSYSMVRVHVPMATPAASSAAGSSYRMGNIAPSGVSAEERARSSPAPSASASHGIMFTGDAARLSGGIVSAAATVMGVLAFIL
ncbi:hypothetical protein N7475_009768 [Penicillium sp. IBT 31633x]|nr:hypothetical protein N7475_009768 [Penicillium sp. IBT 31633x]